jgi:hypothetical protein
MKIIIIENLYPKFEIVNKSIGYIENVSFTYLEWTHDDVTMHPPINVFVNFNDFIEKNIKLKGLLKNVIPIIPISRNFQYHHHILELNSSKTFIINNVDCPSFLSHIFQSTRTNI